MASRKKNGQFKKGHTSSHSRGRKSSSTALVRRSGGSVVVVEKSRAPARRRHGGGGGGGGGGLTGHASKAAALQKLEICGFAALLGYLSSQKAETFDKIPTFKGLPRELIVGAVAFLGRKNKHIDMLATAALAVGFNKFGANDFHLSGDDD